MSSRTISAILVCALALFGGLVPERAQARLQQEARYPFQRVWNTTLRMVRVDLRLPVTDRDPEAGYMLFEYVDQDRRYPGSFEIIAAERDKQPVITVVVNVSGMPSYVERMLLDKLEKKLNAEYGAPMEPPKVEAPPDEAPPEQASPAKKPDEGADELPKLSG